MEPRRVRRESDDQDGRKTAEPSGPESRRRPRGVAESHCRFWRRIPGNGLRGERRFELNGGCRPRDRVTAGEFADRPQMKNVISMIGFRSTDEQEHLFDDPMLVRRFRSLTIRRMVQNE